MTQSPITANDSNPQGDSEVELRAINAWLESQPLPSLTEELETLISQTIRLRHFRLGHDVRANTLEKIYRIAGFIVLGLVLIGVSYLYQYLRKTGFFDKSASLPNKT